MTRLRPLRTPSSYVTLLSLLALGAGACASSGSSSGSRSGRDVITADEIAQLPPGTAYEVVSRLRGNWLIARGGQRPQVHIDGRPSMGGLDELRSIRSTEIESIRYRNARDATTMYGTNYSGGVIEVTTKS
jgi:hypothetical protein